MKCLLGLVAFSLGQLDDELVEKPLTDDREDPIEPYPIIVGSGSEVICITGIDGSHKWTKKIGEDINSVPILSYDNVAYITADDDALYAINIDDGKRLWKFEVHDPITVSGSTLSKDEKMIFVPTMDGTIYGINIENEQPTVTWKYETDGEIEGPIVHDYDRDIIYVTSMCELPEENPESHSGHDFYGIHPTDGSLVFHQKIHETVAFPVYVQGEIINVLTYNNGYLYQYDRETGQATEPEPAKAEFTAPSDAFPVLDQKDNILYFGFQTGGLGAINLATHTLEFQDELDKSLILTAMTLCAGQMAPDYEEFKTLYFGTQEEVVKYDVLERKIVWKKDMKAIPSLGAPVLDNWGQLIVSTEGGQTHALNSATGEEIWSVKTGSEVLYGLAIPEDFQDPRCGAVTIHFMDEMVMMDKIFGEMFDDDDFPDVEDNDEEDEIRMEDEDEDEEPVTENGGDIPPVEDTKGADNVKVEL